MPRTSTKPEAEAALDKALAAFRKLPTMENVKALLAAAEDYQKYFIARITA